MAREANSGHSMKLFNGQDENNDPSEEGGEERTATLEDLDKSNCCPSERKHLFGIPVDETTMKFSTGPSIGSSKSVKNRLHRAGKRWLHKKKLATVRMRETMKLRIWKRYATVQEDENEKEEKKAEEKRRKEEHSPLGATVPGGGEEYPQDPEYLHAG